MGILADIKKVMGIDPVSTSFDTDLVFAINTAFMDLNQLGVGPAVGFKIAGETENWDAFFGVATNIEGVKSYIQLKTRILFDPPSSSFILSAHKEQLNELAWRLMVQTDPIVPDPVDPEV